MIPLKNQQEITLMKTAGALLAELFLEISHAVRAGTTTGNLDAFVEAYLAKHSLVSQSKGYHGYRHVSCISVNDEIVHGVPGDRIIHEGDLVKIDICAAYKGYCADMARCFFVGEGSLQAQRLVATAQAALDAGIAQTFAGNKLSSISAAIQKETEAAGYGVVRDFAGHGIGRKMHEAPEIVNYGKPGRGILLKEGMVFALEPMITQGNYAVYIERDGWTAKTVDKSLAAHVEDTVCITSNGPEILTRL